MLFYSFEFMYLFLPVTLTGYYLIGRRKRHLSVKWIVACSMFFYGWWNPYYLVFLLGSIFFNYFFGLLLRNLKNKILMILGIGVNLFFIGYFKYAGFLISISNDLSGHSFSIGDIVLPLGISFFTFQQISWLIDNFYDRISIQDRGIWEYGQFVIFFPQLIAGPIVHHSEMMPQFYEDKNRFINWDNIAAGISIFVIGLAKKVIIADSVAPYANEIFNIAKSGKPLLFFEAWIGSLAYTVQIYFDFSGYADMAIGLALMFNVHLPLNFDSPYKSTCISEFWRRWHMTLGRFMREYVYIPLGGNRKGEFKAYSNLFVTMLICGVWHGAGWTFILWGGVHGIFMLIDRLWNRFSPIRLPNLIATCLTFLSVVFAWVLFRAESLKEASYIQLTMLGVLQTDSLFIIENKDLIKGLYIIIPSLLIGFFLPNTQTFMGKAFKVLNPIRKNRIKKIQNIFLWKTNIYWAGYTILLSLISLYCILDQTNVQEFIYFQF